jgi:hypothetical protein
LISFERKMAAMMPQAIKIRNNTVQPPEFELLTFEDLRFVPFDVIPFE